MLLNLGQDLSAHDRKKRLIRPVCFGDEVVQRLVGGLHATWLDPRGDRFDALARAGEDQPRAVGLQRCGTIGMAEHLRQAFDIGCKARLARSFAIPVIHPSLSHQTESPRLYTFSSS